MTENPGHSTEHDWCPTIRQGGDVDRFVSSGRWAKFAGTVRATSFLGVTGHGDPGEPICLELPVAADVDGALDGVGWVYDSTGRSFHDVTPALLAPGVVELRMSAALTLGEDDLIGLSVTYGAAQPEAVVA